jgi:hypothetical protein
MNSRRIFVCGLVVLLMASPAWAVAKGPIPIKPPKTFPFVINQPGSYQLISNITVPTDGTAIQIDVSNVTLDLNGFTVQCAAGVIAPGINSATNSSQHNVTVRNGVVHGFGGDGVRLFGSGNVVMEVKVDGNGLNGVEVVQGSTVERCIVIGNGLSGITASQDCSIRENVCTGNGIHGVRASQACAVLRNTCNGNGVAGIQGDQGSTLIQNTCSGNSDTGIQAAGQCLVQQNNCSLNDTGISCTGSNNAVVENACLHNNTGMNLAGGGANYIAQNKLGANGATITNVGGNTLGSGDLANVTF